MSATPTRRQVFTSAAAYAAGAAIVAAGVSVAEQATGATLPGVSPELQRRIAAWYAHDAKIARFYVSTFNPAVTREQAMVDAIPHVTMDASMAHDGSDMWTTASRLHRTLAHFASHSERSKNPDPQWQAKRTRARSFYAAHLRRERAIRAAHRTSGMEAADAQEVALYDERRTLLLAVCNFPPATVADLKAKLDLIEAGDGLDDDDLMHMVQGDVDALLGREVRA